MGCVNKSSSEFKKLAAKYNLDNNGLELIVHKYWLETGNETLFPTDTYIQAQLGNLEYQESGKSVRKLWEQRYSSPKEFDTYNDMKTTYNEATKFFPESAIVYYNNGGGKYVLAVKKPVEKIKRDKKEFFKKADTMGGSRTLDLAIKEHESYSVDKMQELFDKFNTDRTSKDLANRVFNIVKELGLNVVFEGGVSGKKGEYRNDNTVRYSKQFLEHDNRNDLKASVILHEAIHAISMYALSGQTANWKRPKDLENFRTEINAVFNELRDNPSLRGERGMLDVKEFIAELGNPAFRSKLQDIDKANKEKTEKRSIWQRILDAFKSLLGIHPTSNYYERSMKALDKAISAFDVDAYMVYNRMKNPLREAYHKYGWDINSMTNKRLKDEVINAFDKKLKSADYNTGEFSPLHDEIANYEIDNGNINDLLSDEEKRDILSEIKKINGAKRTLIDTGGDYLYVVDHTDKEGLEHLKNGQEGFLCKVRFDVRGLDKNEIDNIKKHYDTDKGSNETTRRFEHWLEGNGYSERYLDSNSLVIEDREATDNDDKLDSQKHGQASLRGRGSDHLQEDFPLHEVRTGYDGTNHPRYITATKEFLQSLSEDEVKQELSLMKQEENDYDTLFAIEPSKKTERTGPQDFTFADGTTLRVPFKPNDQQVAALNAMDEFIQNKDEHIMTLSGYAGTGKTSLMEIIARKASLDGNEVAFTASTNKAASVLDSKVSKLGYRAVTLNKLFGITVEADTKSKAYDASKLKTSLRENDIRWGTTVIIDEASMINKENYDIINYIAQTQGLKIIYVGDAAQLPPVKSEEISPVFKDKKGKVVTLTQVERTDDNAILKEATAIRNGESLSGVSSFNAKGEGVAYISASNKEAVDDIINHYVPELKNNPNYFRILAFTNKAVAEYNEKVRKALGYDSPVPRVGEAMMGYKNWGYNPFTHGFDFINSESYKVITAKDPVRISRRTQDGHTLYMEAVPLTLEDSLGNRVKVNYMDVKNNPVNREVAYTLAGEKTVLWQMWYQTHSKNVMAKINDIDKFLFINDTLISKDGSKRVLQEKIIDFGYALTTHKSQGSTFTHVLLDDVDIAKHTKSKNSMNDDVDLFDNTDETVEDYSNAEMTSDSGDMGLFDDMDLSDSSEGKSESKTVSQPNVSQNQEVNLRQMLEYVGVSRATDTVSVISNNVKKEDSPLNHLANIATMNTKELVKKIQSDSQKMNLTSDEKYYTDENGNKFARVTSVITTEEDRFDPNSPWAVPSSAVGTGVDVFFRDFFDGEIGNPNTLAERYPNADQEHLRALYDKLQAIKEHIKGNFTVVPKDVTLKGQVTVSDKNGKRYSVNVAGTVDLLIHDNNGNFFIYDMKTHHSKEPIDHNPTKLARYTKQVSLYKALFEQQYPGHPVKSLALLPIHVEYPAPKGFGNGTAEYTSDRNTNQLYLNGSEFRAANPVLEKTIQVTPQEVTVKYEDLSNEAKAIAVPVDGTINNESQRSEETKPVDWRETLNQEFDHLRKMGINVFLHEGMQRFLEENPNKFVQMAINNSNSKQYEESIKAGGTIFQEIYKLFNRGEYEDSKTNEGKTTEGQSLRARSHEEALKQQKALVEWAEKNHKAIYEPNDYYDENLGEQGIHGSESKVWIDKGRGVVIKSISPNHYQNIRALLDRIAIHNMAFPATAISLKGIGLSDNGVSLIVEQPFIDDSGEIPSLQEIQNFMVNTLGFTLSKGKGINAEYTKNGYIVSDIRPENVIKQSDGTLKVIDCFAMFQPQSKDTEFFLTPRGEVYGFVDKNNDIYLDERKISPEHPIHEYTHIWDRVIASRNSKLWQRGVELMKQTPLWQEILSDDNYGKRWQAMKGMPQSQLDGLIASEVHARLSGKKGMALIEEMAKKEGQKGIIGKLKQWLLDMWKELKKTFSPWTQEDLDKLTLDDFTNMTVRDFMEGINPMTAKDITINNNNNGKEQLKNPTGTDIPALKEAKKQLLSLPNYQDYNNMIEDVAVDAEWKAQYLEELDRQITDGNSQEKNNNIIKQMNKVLQATTEKEYLKDQNDPNRNKTERILDEYDKLNKQIDNLLEGGEERFKDFKELGVDLHLSASEIRHTAELIVNSISDEITKIQNDKEYFEKAYPEVHTTKDLSKASRQEVVETVGINSLIDKAKYYFDSDNAKYDNIGVSIQADLITENWDAMMLMASDIFAFNEGFGISRDYNEGKWGTTEASEMQKTVGDDFNRHTQDTDIPSEEGPKDEQEKWQIDTMTVDVLNSMSALVRQGLHECYLLDAEGNKVMSKWGIAERVNPREATNSILRWTQGSLSLDNMIKKLSEKQKQNPWLSQLISRLSDNSGNNTDFQSQFYGVFQKHFQLYSIVMLEDGKYHTMEVNRHPALKEAMDTITAQYRAGESTFLGTDGSINRKMLGNDKTTGKEHEFNLHKALHEIQEARDSLKHGGSLDDAMSKTIAENVQGVCRVFGYPITEDIISDSVNKENIDKWAENLGYIVKDLREAAQKQDEGKLKNYDPFGFYKDNNIRGSLSKFLAPAVESLEDTAINAFYDSGKMYQSYVTPSFMSKLFNKFRQTGENFQKFIMDEYGNSEWFAFDDSGYGDYDMMTWRNEWLRLLARDENAQKVFDHKVELNFNKHNYMRNMTDAEYTLSLITEYFSEYTDDRKGNLTPAWFRVPMQSNKPSSDFIRFYSYRGSSYKRDIVRGLHMMFLQELSRIQTVNMRNLSKKDPAFIKNFDTNGKKFNFLPALNAYLENTEEAKAKREELARGVGYDETRLEVLEKKERAYNEAKNRQNSTDANGFIDLSENSNFEKDLKALELSEEEQNELHNLRQKRDSNKSAITSEENDRFAELLQKKTRAEEALTADEEAELGNLADKVIMQSMENRVNDILDAWEKNGILEAAKNIKDIHPLHAKGNKLLEDWNIREKVENFLWNDSFASKNILQLTIGDIAFYKDAEDLQKRLAQLHAPGIRGNIYAVDYNGNRVSDDGKYRTIILKDFNTFVSNIIDNISEVFDRKIREAQSEDNKKSLRALKEHLVGENGEYRKINVTDAQGYSSPTSYRKKAIMFGRWSKKAEEIYQNLQNNPSLTNLEVAFQPLKPFVYSRLTKDMGVDNAPIHNMHVPFQAKNAEYLLIMADALLQGEKTSRPNLLRAVYRIMEDSAYDGRTYNADGSVKNPGKYNGKGIDTVQFESAIKSGLQGTMDISQFMDMPKGEDAAYAFMKEQIYKNETNQDTNERLYVNYNSDVFVHETSFDDYCLQQEVPEHFKMHSQAHGSQIRMITPSDLDFYTTDENGKQVDNYYPLKEPDGTVRKLKADEFRKEFEQTISDQIEDSINTLSEELHLNSGSIKERNIALSRILQREIMSSPRYGIDLMQACQVDKETGEFRIPMGDPIQAKRIEQLINSLIKNRINKQKIAGGPIVQVSNFGTSKQLHIRFNDKQGNLMPLKEDYNPSEHDNLSWDEYIKKHQGGIAYFEVFAPIWSDEIQEKFGNPDGSINVAAIEATDPELLKMVSYRIPTEDKYSCAPMKVVGFMPRIAGDAIMLPNELTTIDDSDFDVDKRYVMRKDNGAIMERTPAQVEKLMIEKFSEDYKAKHGGKSNDEWVKEKVHKFMTNPKSFSVEETPLLQDLQRVRQSVAFYTNPPKSGRKYRDNKIVDMTFAVLTNERTADKILNPGGFDAPKQTAYKIAAYRQLADKGYTWNSLNGKDTDDLKKLCYTDKDLTFADTQVQFYKQNSAAASLIGVFAVNKVAHATLESNDIFLNVSSKSLCGEQPFTIADTEFGGMMQVDKKYDSKGNLIGKTLGSLVSASADAVKDPILNLINVNMTTAGMLNSMLRLGMPFDDAALFLSQDVISRALSQFNKENLNNYASLDSIINKMIDEYNKKYNFVKDSKIAKDSIDRDELVEGLTSKSHDEIDYKVLLAFQKLRLITDAIRKATFATRFNSISSAVGPLVIDNLIIERKMNEFKDSGDENTTNFFTKDGNNVDIDDIFYDHPVLASFAKTVGIAKQLLSKMPANSAQFRRMLGLEELGNADSGDSYNPYPDTMPKSMADKMFGDKKLLDQFSNFYQSYMLIQSGVASPSDFKYYIEEFPKEFVDKKYGEKYADNALIQAIKLNISKKSDRPYLKINLTGMDESKKEELRSAWIDLHKTDPELSKKLFDYSFFVAGVSFSPKTFMALVPTYVKERLKGKDGKASYVDTYRNFPTVVPSLVIDQFVRNNWNNNKIVPKKGGKGTNYHTDLKNGKLYVTESADMADLAGVTYMKTKLKGTDYMWHLVSRSKDMLVFERVAPLGNNGEYLEMSLTKSYKALSDTAQTSESLDASPMEEKSAEESAPAEPAAPVVSDNEKAKRIVEFVNAIMQNVGDTEKRAKEKYESSKANPKMYVKFIKNMLEKMYGKSFNIEEALEEFKKYC